MDLIKKYLMKDIDVLLNCIDEAVLIVDRDANIVKYNETFSRLTDLMGRSIVGRNLKEIVARGLLEKQPHSSRWKSRKKLT